MKVKVKVAGQPVAPKVAPKVTPNGQSMGMFPKMNHIVQKKKDKSIFGKMLYIINEDIKSIFKKDQKSKEEKMKYDAFMEMMRK